jgi:nucleoside-diphosphate-sugar epimerase
LVTGAAGFIGSRLVEKLCVEEGANVQALVRSWHTATWVSRTTATLHQGDVADGAAVARAMAGCELVFHCASGGGSREGYRRTNVEGTENIMRAAREAAARVVYVSSTAVHGPRIPGVLRPDSPFRATGKGYGDSKIEAERLLRERYSDIPTVIVRPSFVWGPRSHLFTVGPLLAMSRGAFRLVDEGRGRCHAVYVDHLVEALILAGIEPRAVDRAFIVTDDFDGLTWRDFYLPLSRLLDPIPTLGSVSSASPLIRAMSAWKSFAEERLAGLAGNPAPWHRRAIRRALYETLKPVNARGVPSTWDLWKYTQRGTVDLTDTREILGFRPSHSFDQAFDATSRWIHLQLGETIPLRPLTSGRRADEDPAPRSGDRLTEITP